MFYVTYNSIFSISMTTIGGRNITWKKFGEEKVNFSSFLYHFSNSITKMMILFFLFFLVASCQLFGTGEHKRRNGKTFLFQLIASLPSYEKAHFCVSMKITIKKSSHKKKKKSRRRNFPHNSTSFFFSSSCSFSFGVLSPHPLNRYFSRVQFSIFPLLPFTTVTDSRARSECEHSRDDIVVDM